MSSAPTTRTGSTRELFVSPDPEAVAEWCRDRITPECMFVAPSASARRSTVRSVAAASGITIGLTVISPARLVAALESRAGLGAPRMLPRALARMLVVRAARMAGLPMFADTTLAPPAGAVRAVARLFSALRTNRVSAMDYLAAGGDSRAAEAFTLFENERVARDFVDDTGRIDRLIAAGIAPVAIVLQEPQVAHRAAADLLLALIAAATSCHAGVADLGTYGAALPAIAFLERAGLHVTRADAPDPSPATRAVGGVGMFDEVELTARHIKARLRSGATEGEDRAAVTPHDVLAVAPSTSYLALLGDACMRIGVPIASPRTMPVADVPLVRAIMETCTLLANESDDTAARGLALLGMPYVGLSLREHDRMARKLVTRGLGGLRTWQRVAPTAGRAKFQTFAESIRALAHHFSGERPPRELARTLQSIGLDYGFLSAGRRAYLAAGRDDAVRVDQQGWDALTDAIEELDDALRVLNVATITARAWLGELAASLADTTVRVDAKERHGVHLTVATVGLRRARHVFALGWREGLMPRRVRDEPLLSDHVKRALNERGAMFELGPDRTARDAERRERIRRAAKETLTISWPAMDEEGETLLSSFYLDDLKITDRVTRGIGDTTWATTLAATRGERLARATFVAHHGSADTARDELPLVRETLARLTAPEQRSYGGALHAAQSVPLPPDIVARIAPMAGAMSATQANAIAHCLYEHFGKRRLRLAHLEAPVVDQLLLGTIAHLVLGALGASGFDPGSFDAVFTRVWGDNVPAELVADPASLFARSILEQDLRDVVQAEHALFATIPARPTHFELGFGLDTTERDPASRADGVRVELPAGGPLAESVLRGAIDRVDVLERDGTRYGVAIDYKIGKGKSNDAEMNERADFQLPTYCAALPAFGIEPVGAYYLGVSGGERYGLIRDDFADAFGLRDLKRVRKVSHAVFADFMGERQQALAAEIMRATLGTLVAKPRLDDCKFCDLRPLCRIGTFGVGMAHSDE